MSDIFSQKITELPLNSAPAEGTFIPLSDPFNNLTGKSTLTVMRQSINFENAYTSVANALLKTKENDVFYVFGDQSLSYVLGYVNRGNNSYTALLDGTGEQVIRATGAGISNSALNNMILNEFEDLRHFKPVFDGQLISIKEHSTGTAKGGGQFVGHLGTKTDDGGIVAAGSGFYWERVIDNKTISPEMFGAIGDGATDDTTPLQLAMNNPGYVVFISSNYLTTRTLVPLSNVTIRGHGTITHVTTENFIWSGSSRVSNYPALKISSKNVTIEEITIVGTYESIASNIGGDNLIIRNVTAGGTEDKRCKSSVFVFFNTKATSVFGCSLGYAGNLATWNGSDIAAGGCDGIDFGGCNGVTISQTKCHNVGRNGINWYGAADVYIDNCHQTYCGQSGIQPGPHPNYRNVFITNNLADYCCADAIDCRYTGSPAVDVNMTIDNCQSNWIGMLYGDVTYISNDGTGTVTLAMVNKVTVSNCISNNTTGVIAWFEGVSDCVMSNIVGNSQYSRYGVGFFTSCNRVSLNNINVVCKGSALWFGGGMTLTDVRIGGNSYFESIDSYSLLMPNITLTRFKVSQTTFVGYNVANVIFHTSRCEFIMKGTTASAVYLGVANTKHDQLRVSGSTSASLVNIGVSTGVMIDSSEFINSGTGAALSIVGGNLFVISKSVIYNTGSGTGNALEITGGQNGSVFAYNDIYSASGYWVKSTAASHTRLITDSNKENGALGSSWVSITNVFNISPVQRT
ncbi:EPS depolymerase [Klebsiella phage vB_KpM_Centimanus]